jgi:acyl dehydratase
MDETWQEWVGRTGEEVAGPYPVSIAAIGYVAEAVEDARLLERIAAGGLRVAPATFVNVAARVPGWQPPSLKQPPVLLAASVPLPADAAVNRRVAQRYFAPLLVGDTVSSRSTIVAIEPKRTRLGDGFMVTEEIEHRNGRGELVATTGNTAYRYDRHTVGAAADEPRPARPSPPRAAPAGVEGLPPVVLPVTTTMLVKAAGGVRDFIPLHHDVETARRSGLPTMFASWSTLLAFVGRASGEWFGVDAVVRGAALDMRTPVFVGRTLTCEAIRLGPSGDGGTEVDFALRTEDGTCTTGTIDVEVPAGARTRAAPTG